MAFRTLLMPIAPERGDRTSLQWAIQTGRLLDCHLDIVFVRPDPAQAYVHVGLAPDHDARSVEDIRARLGAQGQHASDVAQEMVLKTLAQEDVSIAQRPAAIRMVSAAWHEAIGEPVEVVAAFARSADAVVFTPETAKSSLMSENVLDAALLRSGRPVLYLPDGGIDRTLSRVLIAWDGSGGCARAISSWLASGLASEHAVIVTVADPHGRPPDMAGVEAHLAWHGISSQAEIIDETLTPVGQALLDAARDFDCGLIVTGGYGHSRNWEAVFGGVTRYMLQHTPVPLLMTH